jgi:ABC-type branched-subunit amino acid transport system ATPase component
MINRNKNQNNNLDGKPVLLLLDAPTEGLAPLVKKALEKSKS